MSNLTRSRVFRHHDRFMGRWPFVAEMVGLARGLLVRRLYPALHLLAGTLHHESPPRGFADGGRQTRATSRK